MRWGALLILAACGGGTGVDLDIFVPSEANVDRVELWVAYEECYDCANGVAWMQGERASGKIYFLYDEKVIRAVQQGDRWVVHLDVESSGYSTPPWLAIAAFSGDKVTAVKVLRDVRIPVSSVVRWQAYLHPAEPATTDLMTAPLDLTLDHRAHVWARGPTAELPEPTGCLAYQKWEGSWDTEYFVPKTDPDCDGVPIDKECSEYWFNYKPSVSTCVLDAGVALPDTCVLGASLCADGISNDRTCRLDSSNPITCVVDAICDHCSDDIPADGCVKGVVETAIANDTTAHYHCDFDSTQSGEPCIGQFNTLQLPFANAQCGTPKLHYIDRPFTDAMDALTFGVAPDVAKFTIKPNATAPCLVNIEWTGGTIEAFKDGVVFLIDVPYDNATRALYPVQLKATNTTISCSVTATGICTPGGPPGDGVVHCAAAP